MERLRRLAHWLDEGIRIPGTRWRIGLDPILGLVPGLGDAVGAILAVAMVVEAVRRRATRFTLLRMATNIVLDAVLGSVPIVGDVFDAAWKANLRNLVLLERPARPSEAKRDDRLFVMLLGGLLLVICLALVSAGVVVTVGALKALGRSTQ